MTIKIIIRKIEPTIVKPKVLYFGSNRLPSPIVCAWTAGIVDGEGNLCIQERVDKGNGWKWFSIKVTVTNTDFRMVDIRPYLVIKGEQADICMMLQERIMSKTGSRSAHYSKEEYNARAELFNSLRRMTARGREKIPVRIIEKVS